jgi:hypothetical protein
MREGHGAEGTERCDPHDDPDHTEHDQVEQRLAALPSKESANANKMAKKRTCRISPSAKAPTTVAGMILRKNSTVPCCPALVV